MKKTTANLLLISVTIAWGLGFIFTKFLINNNTSPAVINMVRGFIFTALTLIFFHKRILRMTFNDFRIGLVAGSFNLIGFLLQTIGAQYTTPSNSAFLTVTSVVMMPFIVWVIYKKRPGYKIYLSVIICMVGMAILTGFTSKVSNIGDLLSLLCAFFFGLSIAVLSHSAKNSDWRVIAFMMGITHFVGSVIYWIIAEGATIPSEINYSIIILPLIFLGVFSSFLAQTIQVIAQRYTNATTAALIFTLEAVWGAFFSIIFGYDIINSGLIIGGLLIMISLIISEYDYKRLSIYLKQ